MAPTPDQCIPEYIVNKPPVLQPVRPRTSAGIMCDISDRPSLCSAAHWGRGEVVVGSSDHALYIIDTEKVGGGGRGLLNLIWGTRPAARVGSVAPDGFLHLQLTNSTVSTAGGVVFCAKSLSMATSTSNHPINPRNQRATNTQLLVLRFHQLFCSPPQGDRKRTLYTKQCGHTDWVLACCFTPSGQVVSGGQDNRLWVWPAGGMRGACVDAHEAPVSRVVFDVASGCVASASYDKVV